MGMKLLKTEITPFINQSMKVEYREQSFLWSPYHSQPSFHSHPELELVFIVEGHGKRIVGNKVEPFESGDMVFIGSNVPHLWLSDPVYYKENSGLKSRVVVCYFNPKIFQQMFEAIEEFGNIRDMIRQSSKGIRILGETRNVIAQKLMALSNIQGFEKVEGLLQIMHLISSSEEKEFIVNHETDCYDDLYPDRLIDVIRYVKENLNEQISLRQVADVACMTEQSFCRFFKKRTKKSFSRFLSELRVAHACQLLIQTDKQVMDVACLCGFNTSTHFCKVFKAHTGVTPYHYRISMTR